MEDIDKRFQFTTQYIPQNNEDVVTCPVCGDPNQHPVGVRINPAGSMEAVVEVMADGIHIDKSLPKSGRGVRISVLFNGECGHVWEMSMQFHKGETAISVAEHQDGPQMPTIWRD